MVRANIGTEHASSKDATEITRLENSHIYAISHVFIVIYKTDVRLIAMNRNRILYDQIYRNLRGAKIAFDRLFKKRMFDLNDFKANWTPPYPVSLSWLIPKLEKAEKFNLETLLKKNGK